jgi:hypothetical protein
MHAKVSGMEGHGCDCRPAEVQKRVASHQSCMERGEGVWGRRLGYFLFFAPVFITGA